MENRKITNRIADSVADTLYIPLAMKCRETNRKNGFFRDSFACDLMNRIEYDFSKYSKAVRSSVGVAIRARYFDELTRGFIEKNSSPVVVHIGCGLDTRFQRLGSQITSKTIFYEIDLPEVITLRKKLLPESANNIYVAASMFETTWMDDIKKKHPKSTFLFLVEGVFMYFEAEKVKSVVKNLALRFSNSSLVFDAVNSWMCKNSHRHDTVKLTKTSFRFPFDDNRLLEQWDDKLHFESVRYFGEFKEWKHVGFISCLAMQLIPAVRYASRMVVYSIT